MIEFIQDNVFTEMEKQFFLVNISTQLSIFVVC
jgi:hypothetical protein